jgi:hypothetical protein
MAQPLRAKPVKGTLLMTIWQYKPGNDSGQSRLKTLEIRVKIRHTGYHFNCSMIAKPTPSIIHHFSSIKDPRVNRQKKHQLQNIFFI